MKKGDLKKQEILAVAEEMFCRNGYEQTSVQDIIDRMHSSKGSFYHHFESKQALLEGICAGRAGQIFRAASAEAEKEASAVKRLEILLTGMIPFKDEKITFLMMLLPVFTLPEGRVVRQYYSDALSGLFHDSVCSQIRTAHENGEVYSTDPENAAHIILLLVNDLWTRIADRMIQTEQQGAEPDLSEMLRITESCRICIERFLSLPYGSVSVIDIPALGLLAEKIHNHWAG